MKNLFSLFLVGLICSCNTSSKVESDCYIKVKSELLKDWIYVPDSGFYRSEIIYSLMKNESYRNCLKTLDSSDVVHIFGVPTKSYPSRETINTVKVLAYTIAAPKYTALLFMLDSVHRVNGASMVGSRGTLIHN